MMITPCTTLTVFDDKFKSKSECVGLKCSKIEVDTSQVFGGGVYLKNSPKLETGVTASSTVGGASTFGIGCKYSLGPDARLRAKVNNSKQIGLSYQQKLRDGITMTMSANIDGNKLNESGHKLGMCLEMEA